MAAEKVVIAVLGDARVHRSTCLKLKDEEPHGVLLFSSVGDAIQAGFQPCGTCGVDPTNLYEHVQAAQAEQAKRGEMTTRSLTQRASSAYGRASGANASAVAATAVGTAYLDLGTGLRRNIGSTIALGIELGVVVPTEHEAKRLREAQAADRIAGLFYRRAAVERQLRDAELENAGRLEQTLARSEERIATKETMAALASMTKLTDATSARAAQLAVMGEYLDALELMAIAPQLIDQAFPDVAQACGEAMYDMATKIAYLLYVRGEKSWEEEQMLAALGDWQASSAISPADRLYSDAVEKASVELDRRHAAQVAEKLLELANEAWQGGDRAKSIKLYAQCGQTAPQGWAGAEPLLNTMAERAKLVAEEATQLLETNDYTRAVECWSTACGLAPDDKSIAKGRDEAVGMWCRHLREQAEGAFAQGDYAAAEKCYAQIAELMPGDAGIARLVEQLATAPKQLQIVRPALREPWSTDRQLTALAACIREDDTQLAVRELERNVSDSAVPGLPALLLARVCALHGQEDEAHEALLTFYSPEQFTANRERLPDGRSEVVALAQYGVPTTKEAVACVETNASDPLAPVLLAATHFDRGRGAECAASLDKQFAEQPAFGPSYLLASCLHSYGMAPKGTTREEILPILSLAVWGAKLDPANRLAHIQCALLYTLAGCVPEAQVHAEIADSLGSGGPRLLLTGAIVAVAAGDAETALSLCTQVMQYEAFPAATHFVAACAYKIDGNLAKANRELGECRKADASYRVVEGPCLEKGMVRIVREMLPQTPELIRACAASPHYS